MQKCHYCDFVKYGVSELPPIEDYFKLLFTELKQLKLLKSQSVKSLYFGGGTPSLASKKDLKRVVDFISSYFCEDPEITLEINPGTLTKNDFTELSSIGFNRFSLGVQTFNERLLKACGRLHSSDDSLRDLHVLSTLDYNFSMDLLFGLPGQSVADLTKDLKIITSIKPPHVSSYNLTLSKDHRFNENRPSDDIQIKMMELINTELLSFGCKKYEVSNFSQSGFESQHNRSYWEDKSYFGFGIGAHSYDKNFSKWGKRYWNTAHYEKYKKCIESEKRSYQGFEVLKLHESLTDLIHTRLRQVSGLNINSLKEKFNLTSWSFLEIKLNELKKEGLLHKNKDEFTESIWSLTEEGFKKTNLVFLKLCFSKDDIKELY